MDANSFTLVFEGNIREFDKNPLKVETEFGIAYAAGIGNAFDRIDALEELMGKAIKLLEVYDIDGAVSALKEEV